MSGNNDEKRRECGDGGIGNKGDDSVLVSVSCITFNHGRFLREALDGFLKQETDFRYEILIHDDCSTDDTLAILREYEALHPSLFRIMTEEENQYSKGISNISGVFNFPRARGKYIAMCEGDDFWSDPKKLQKQADYMEAHPECALCCHAAGIVSEDGAFRTQSVIRPYEKTKLLRPEELISKKSNLPTASLFFRAEDAKKLPAWYYACPVGDIPLQLFLLTCGNVYYMDEIMSMYRMGRAGSWQESMDSPDQKEAFVRRWEAHALSMQQLYDAFDEETGGVYHAAVTEALQRQRFHIDLKEEKWDAAADPSNARFLGELPGAEAKLLRLRARAPGVYRFLQKTYGLLRRNAR